MLPYFVIAIVVYYDNCLCDANFLQDRVILDINLVL